MKRDTRGAGALVLGVLNPIDSASSDVRLSEERTPLLRDAVIPLDGTSREPQA
jgi:hypothetical protein